MKLLTLNTWQERGPWRERWGGILKGIADLAPDLIAFQEVFNAEWAREVRSRASFSSLVLPPFACGLVILTRYPVLAWGSARLWPSPLENYDRGVLWAAIEIRRRRIVLLNTHLSWKPEDGGSRLCQAGEILRLAEGLPRADALFLAGDLNAVASTREIESIGAGGRCTDLYRKFHPREQGFTWDHRNPYTAEAREFYPDRRIDYIFMREKRAGTSKPLSCDIVLKQPDPRGVWPSDHFGLMAKWSLPS